ncbi:substrate-binding domain-containing protein [Rhodococcus aerolatus]
MVVVVLLVLAVIGWFKVRDSSDSAGAAAAATCLDGTSTLAVAAAPDVAPVVTQLAAAYTERRTVVRDQCVEVLVTPVAPGAALAGLQGTWDTAADGPEPALWIPSDTTWATRAATIDPSPVTGVPRSLGSSPVLLAVPAAAAPAVADAGLTWADVAARQGTAAWGDLGQPGWPTFTQALPPAAPGGDLTPLVGQAVAAGAAGTSDGPVTAAQVADPATTRALAGLAAGPDPQPASASDALATLTGLGSVPGSAFQAVAATEQQLLALDQGPTPVAGVALAGATPVADHPLVTLQGSWVDETQARASAAFAEDLTGPDAQQQLTVAELRAGGGPPTVPDGLVVGTPGTALALADAAATTAVLDALARPAAAATPARTTVLLDVSGSTGAQEGPGTRLANTAAALTARVQALPDQAAVGLWPFSRNLDGDLPYRVAVPTGPLTDPVGGVPRRQALATALAGLRPESATSSNFALQGAYTAAVQGYVPGRPNTVLLVTDGPNDGITTAADVLSTIRSAGDPARPVRVDVVVVGPGFDTSGLAQVAQATGGTLVDAGLSSGPGLGDALGRLLT